MGHSISKLNNLLFSNQSQRVANINKLKKTIESKSVVKFYLKQKFGEDKPVNYVLDKGSQGNTSFKLKKHEEIEKFLKERKIKKKDIIPKLSELYNEDLTPVVPLFRKKIQFYLKKIVNELCSFSNIAFGGKAKKKIS